MITKKAICFLLLLLVSILIFTLNLISLKTTFITIGILNFIVIYYLLVINPFAKMGLFSIVFLNIIILSLIFTVLYQSFYLPGLVVLIMYVFSSIMALLQFYFWKKKIFIFIYFLLIFSMIYNYDNIFNFYYSQLHKNKIVGTMVPLIKIINSSEELLLTDFQGKVVLIDFWTNTCSICIQEMPEFNRVYEYFKNDKNVEMISINIFAAKADIYKADRLSRKYNYAKYYTDTTIYSKLNFNKVPNYLIIGKDKKIKYLGPLNSNRQETYNNIFKLINNEK